jgi:hypothetical protein
MIEYALKDINEVLFPLNDSTIIQPAKGSFSLSDDVFTFENRIVENSSLHGAVKLGKTRIASRELTIKFSRALGEVYSNFRTAENALLTFLLKAVYLVDVTNSLQVPIAITKYPIIYDPGAYQESSDNEIVLTLLKPFWESTTKDTESDTLSIDINTLIINNQGALAAPPIITFTAIVAVTQIQIYVDETKEGIQIDDSLFGLSGYRTLIIDCNAGTIKIGTLDRISSVLTGTGYFQLPVGYSDLIIIPTAVCHIEVDWYKRFYI